MVLYCPGCGFGVWHNWGVLKGMSPSDESIVAMSGSALAVACYLCRLDVHRELDRCDALRKHIWWAPKQTVRRWLQDALPCDCVALCARLRILARELPSGRVVVLEWRTKDELIECLIASASVLCWHKHRGRYYTDCVTCTVPHDARLCNKRVYYVPSRRTAEQHFMLGMARGRAVRN